MLLAVDIGNSQTSIGAFESGRWVKTWRLETRYDRTSDEYASVLMPLFQQAGFSEDSWAGIALCSVVPSVENAFEGFCRDYLKHTPVVIDHRLDLGFELDVETPQEVGADRLANAAYAVAHLKLPALVIDFGTATTFDLITDAPSYQGGVILPGVRLAVRALSGGTSKLPSIPLEFPDSVIGRSTTACIQSGILYGYCDQLDGLLKRFEKAVGKPCTVALTGGLAYLFQKRLRTESTLIPNLTLEGVALLHSRGASSLSK